MCGELDFATLLALSRPIPHNRYRRSLRGITIFPIVGLGCILCERTFSATRQEVSVLFSEWIFEQRDKTKFGAAQSRYVSKRGSTIGTIALSIQTGLSKRVGQSDGNQSQFGDWDIRATCQNKVRRLGQSRYRFRHTGVRLGQSLYRKKPLF